MKKQQGFTLIELMIVVAIIGILAAVAIPAYTDYMKRGKVSEAITLLGGMKTMAEEYRSSKGYFPGTPPPAAGATVPAGVAPVADAIYDFTDKTGGKYTTHMQIVWAGADEFVVEIGFESDPDLQKGVVALGITYTAGKPQVGKFVCSEDELTANLAYTAPKGSGYTVTPEGYTDTKYLPSTCRD